MPRRPAGRPCAWAEIIGESISARSDQSDEPRSVIADAQREFEEPVYIPGVSALYGGSRGILRVQREKRREVNGEYRDTAAHAGGSRGQKKARPGNPGQAVMILLDAPPLRQDAERDKRPAALGVVNDAGYTVRVGGQLVAIRASENVLAPVSGLCGFKSCGQLHGNAPGPCPANLRLLLKRYLCGLACLDHIARAGNI